MIVLLFGASGMIGQGVLRECLRDPEVRRVITIGRQPLGVHHEKLHEIVQPDVGNLSSHQAELRAVDACFFCLGVSALGMSEASYSAITYDLTVKVAQQLARIAPALVFVYVTGMGTDSSEHGRTMWARVKGRTENALLAMQFRGAYMFRPGFVQPVDGARSKTRWYRAIYATLGPLLPLIRRAFPNHVVTTAEIGRAARESGSR